jgi:aspartate/glutamate racemase
VERAAGNADNWFDRRNELGKYGCLVYRRLNEQVRDGLAEILMRLVDFDAFVSLQKQGRWDEACRILANIARELEAGGAGCLLICTNTMHTMRCSGRHRSR